LHSWGLIKRQQKLNHRIESIKPQKRYKNRFNIKFESGDVFGISGDVLLKFNLSSGQELSGHLISKLESDEIHHKLKEKILNLLSYRSRSTKELEILLLRKGYESSAIKDVLAELTSKKYLNDEEFAKSYASYLIKVKMLGKIGVLNQFHKHEISSDVLEPIIDDLYDKYPPEILIKKIVEKRSKTEKIDIKTNKRLINHLKRKGYTWNEISMSIESHFSVDS